MLRFCFPLAPTSSLTAATLLASARVHATGPSSLPCASSLCFSRRHQRSTSSRPRSSNWEEKTKQFEERQREQQEEAARAARRRARYAASASSSPSSSSSKSGAFTGSRDGNEDVSPTSSSSSAASLLSDRLTKPAAGFWTFLKGGSKGRRTQPINPLMLLERMSGKSQYDPDARAAQRLVDAVNGLRSRNARRKEPMTVQMSEEQKQEIVARYAATRWYGALYRPFQSITERQIRWTMRLSHIGLLLLVVGALVVIFVVYRKEMEAVALLSPEDQADYAYMVRGMRYSDIYKTGKAVLDRDDPLEALPPELRLHMAIEACREKKWHEVDWDVELRTMHPRSALAEWDYVHCLYWTVLEVGRAMAGGGGLFSDRILDVTKAREGAQAPEEERNRFVEMEPTALPAQTKRGFFS